MLRNRFQKYSNTIPYVLMTEFQVSKDIADRNLNESSLIKRINNYLAI
ncbi:hypothetical protein H9X96_13985 [Pedobacter sp. N36a]|nr:hypothetical protein [Pedobacter sp. N36a]MBC8986882.1 hypothetical protein [Pedobacter sp. N36a]